MTNNNMPKKKKNKTITIILVAILLCVIALNVSLFARNKSSQENTYSSSDLSENYENNTTADTEKESIKIQQRISRIPSQLRFTKSHPKHNVLSIVYHNLTNIQQK